MYGEVEVRADMERGRGPPRGGGKSLRETWEKEGDQFRNRPLPA
ncbi:hypothetical protein B005_3673 [Nocardiopsis alba ATCC BAA-2165]|uniref:Uncharacterized protein n=1 Tax=Nocardiopsis alba (strain ATCC BAA-2165 / BE74) TaxID=1205910 RepID=J7LE27_NOCAA|nr:hypothetical protein B005_3673 [Nocardiopsis alba ATCC BAA-2165]